MLKKTVSLLPLLFFMLTTTVLAGSYNYVGQEEFKNWLDTGKEVIIVDIQVADQFQKHHFKNSMETNAFPVKTDEQRAKIDPAVSAYSKSSKQVVVVCPRGGGGAKRCYDYLKSRGVAEKDLVILKGGVEKWPYKEMLQRM